ncbi:LytTR family DNA-binding domain-containing protein [Runella zeae]|uniref:LytTR family DNA-binding domain-containing protein n=1 Tax=Runella zeae TaxID=94255 RepID=UPI000A03C0CE|nr:LytTR family DNA-binding domain-containing protein [Runella zeae]
MMNDTVTALADFVFVGHKNQYERVAKTDIIALTASGAYVDILTVGNKQYRVSTYLANVLEQLNDPNFVRISRKQVVNLFHIELVNHDTVFIGSQNFTVTQSYRQEFMDSLPILRTGKKG